MIGTSEESLRIFERSAEKKENVRSIGRRSDDKHKRIKRPNKTFMHYYFLLRTFCGQRYGSWQLQLLGIDCELGWYYGPVIIVFSAPTQLL